MGPLPHSHFSLGALISPLSTTAVSGEAHVQFQCVCPSFYMIYFNDGWILTLCPVHFLLIFSLSLITLLIPLLVQHTFIGDKLNYSRRFLFCSYFSFLFSLSLFLYMTVESFIGRGGSFCWFLRCIFPQCLQTLRALLFFSVSLSSVLTFCFCQH